MKYFQKEQEEKIYLSTYQQELEQKQVILQDEKDLKVIKYLIELFGDIQLEKSLVKELVLSFSRYGGRYSVKSSSDTLTDLLQIKKEIPTLSTKAIEELGYYYIRDLFEEYDLKSVLHKLIKVFGEEDDTFKMYLIYVDEKGKEYQKQFEEDAKELDTLKDEYGEFYIEYLKSLITRKHLSKDKLLMKIPESELIKKDEQQLLDLSTKYKIFFGACYPLSYTLIEQDEIIDDEFYYYISTTKESIKTTFTKEDYLESIKKKHKQKRM